MSNLSEREANFLKELKTKSLEELFVIESHLEIIAIILKIAGPTLILLMLIYPHLLVILFGSYAVYVMAKMSGLADLCIKVIDERLSEVDLPND